MINYFPVCLSSCGEICVCTGEPEQHVPLELPPAGQLFLGKGFFYFFFKFLNHDLNLECDGLTRGNTAPEHLLVVFALLSLPFPVRACKRGRARVCVEGGGGTSQKFPAGAAGAWHAPMLLVGYLGGGGITQTGVIGVSQQEQLSLLPFLWLFLRPSLPPSPPSDAELSVIPRGFVFGTEGEEKGCHCGMGKEVPVGQESTISG